MAAFSIGQAITAGWELTKKHWRTFGTITLINIVIQIPSSIVSALNEDSPSIIYSTILLLISLSLMMVNYNWIRIAIGLVDGRSYLFNDFFQINLSQLWRYFLASVLYALICSLGLVLVIIPGIIAMIALGQYIYLIPDKQLGAIAALKESARITSGNRLQLFLLGLAYFAMALATIFTLGLGLIVVLPIITMSGFWVYRQLSPSNS